MKPRSESISLRLSGQPHTDTKGWPIPALLAVFALFVGAGCSSREQKPTVFRGHVVFGHEVRRLRPCGTEDALWTTDASGVLWTLHQELAPRGEPYGEVFAVVSGSLGPPRAEGFGADYAGELVVREILYVTLEGFDCETDWDTFSYRAYGNEPFWTVEVSRDGIRLTRPGNHPQTWSRVQEHRSEAVIRYTGFVDADVPAELTLEHAPCRDTMSGAFFGLSATLRLGSEAWTGCALLGSETQEP